MSTRAGSKRGFSLLEIVLALALTAVVVSLVAGAIEFHLRQLTLRKAHLEQSQLARGILRQIADDLRAVVVDRTVDFGTAATLPAAAAAGSGNAGSGSGSGAGDPSGGSSGGSADTESVASDLVGATLLPETPGIYGNAYELQIDVSRIPRFEEYMTGVDPANAATPSVLSDIKTISYFMIGNGLGGTGSIPSSGSGFNDLEMTGMPPGQLTQGLGRRSVDRAVARFSTQNADLSVFQNQVELLAPEVLLIQFRYFDGMQWLEVWDTEDLGGIPLAVEITLVLSPNDERQQNELIGQASLSQFQYDPELSYRLVVYLPASEPIESTDDQGDGTVTSEAVQ